MMKSLRLIEGITILLLAWSCISVAKPSGPDSGSDTVPSATLAKNDLSDESGRQPVTITASPASTSREAALKEIEEFRLKATNAVQNNNLSEAVKLYISAMARARPLDTALFERLNRDIAGIAARLSLEPHESWLNTAGEQLTGNSREAASGRGLMPTVYLYENYGYGKATVQDAIIRFEFIENSGNLGQNVTTDRFGMANTVITSLAQGGRPATIRAYPIFTNEGFSYAFKEIFRDFIYLPPNPLVLVAGIEKTPKMTTSNPQIIDSVAQAIKNLGLDVAPHSSATQPDLFMTAFTGNLQALTQINPQIVAGYYALLLVEINPPVQLVLQGVSYNIFNTTGKLTLRIVRNDGSVVYTIVKDAVRGQGGNVNAAIDDCGLKLQQELTQLIRNNHDALLKAFFD